MDALHALERAVTEAPDAPARVRALLALSTELARNGQAARALALAQQASDAGAPLGDRALEAQTRHALGRCHFYLAEFTPALQKLLEAVRLYNECADLAGAAAAYAGVGICQHRVGAHDDAAAALLRALESARTLKLAALEINTCNSLGSALIGAGRTDEAARWLARGIELAQSAGDRNLLTKLWMNQSVLAKHRGDQAADAADAERDYALGLDQVRHALALARELGNAYDEVHCLGQLGQVLRLLGRHAESDQALQDTLALCRRLNEAHVQAEALLELGRLRLAEGRRDEARALLGEAVDLSRRLQAQAVLAPACQELSAVKEADGDAAAALALYKEFHAVGAAELASSRKHATAAAQLWLDFQDATRREAQYRERAEALAREAALLAEASQQDPLTGLLNRRGLEARALPLLAASDVHGMPLSLALFDVDHFKRINDTHSHAAGDAVLRRLGTLIRGHCRIGDLAVRLGGDEFLLLLAGSDLPTALRTLQRLKQASDDSPWADDAPGLAVTLSIGAAERERGQSLAQAIADADRALYAAKHAGRNRIATGSA